MLAVPQPDFALPDPDYKRIAQVWEDLQTTTSDFAASSREAAEQAFHAATDFVSQHKFTLPASRFFTKHTVRAYLNGRNRVGGDGLTGEQAAIHELRHLQREPYLWSRAIHRQLDQPVGRDMADAVRSYVGGGYVPKVEL